MVQIIIKVIIIHSLGIKSPPLSLSPFPPFLSPPSLTHIGYEDNIM